MASSLALVAGTLMFAGAQANDIADRSKHHGFLSKYVSFGSEASKYTVNSPFATSRDKSVQPAARAQGSMVFTSAGREPFMKTKSFDPPKKADKEEEKAVQILLSNDSNMSIGLSAIGVALFTLAGMLGVRMRRGSQQATTLALARGVGMSIPMTAASQNVLELKVQEPTIRSQEEALQGSWSASRTDNFKTRGWWQPSTHNLRPLTALCAAPPVAEQAMAADSLDGASLAKTMQEFASTADLSWMRELNADPEAAKNAPNRTSREVKSGHFVPVKPKALPNPKLILTSPVMAKQLGLSDEACRSKEFTQFFSGDIDAVPGFKSWATPYALAIMGNPHYNNCPFGNGNGYGDGRAVSVGEIVAPGGQRWELQLKGGGQTPFCRGADGRAVLRSSIREFLASEAMYHLGIDTTRALSLIVSGSETSRRNWYSGGSAGGNMDDPRIANAPPELRQMLRMMMNQQSGEPDMVVNEACAITCRVAPSFTRIGHLDLFARRASKRGCSDAQREEHRMMLQHAFNREYADVMPDAPLQQRALAVYEAASRRIARMVAGWVRVGFCQGNFNCDNCLLGGRTMDYGPFGFIDKYDPGFAKWVGSGDHFAFMNQPGAALANLGTLATALEPILDSAGKQQLQTLVTMSQEIVKSEMDTMWSRKLGFPEASPSSVALFNDLEQLMRNGSVDYTVLFRQLSGLPDAFGSDPSAASSEAILRPLLPAFYGPAPDSKDTPDSWVAWLRRWLTQLSSDGVLEGAGKLMRSENPKYILREYMLVDAYKMAQGGDYSRVEELYSLIRHPFEEQPEFEEKYYRRCPNEALETPGTSVMT